MICTPTCTLQIRVITTIRLLSDKMRSDQQVIRHTLVSFQVLLPSKPAFVWQIVLVSLEIVAFAFFMRIPFRHPLHLSGKARNPPKITATNRKILHYSYMFYDVSQK